MDWRRWMLILGLLLIAANCMSGQMLPKPANLSLVMRDEKVTVTWDPPMEASPRPHYRVEMGIYGHNMTVVNGCEKTPQTSCELTSLIQNYTKKYKVRVCLVTEAAHSIWVQKRFTPNYNLLLPPTFSLLANSSSVMVKIYKKPIFKKMFKFGMTYTVYLQETGQEKVMVQSLTEGLDEEGEEAVLTFHYLHGRSYCVSAKVESKTSPTISEASPQHCIQLPKNVQVWVYPSVLCVAVVLLALVLTLCWVLRRPEKMPAALTSIRSDWLPLSLARESVEVVTNQGWFLSTPRPETMSWGGLGTPAPEEERAEEEKDSRTSLDSGVSVKSHSGVSEGGRGGEENRRREDSGCGSMGEMESITSSRSGTGEPPLQDLQLGSSGSLDGEDCGLLPRIMHLAGDGYRSQSPCSVDLQASKDSSKHIPFETQIDMAECITSYRPGNWQPKTVMADVMTGYKSGQLESKTVMVDVIPGYRSGHVACVRSDKGNYRVQEEHQITPPCFSTSQRQSLTCETGKVLTGQQRNTPVPMETVANLEDSVLMPHALQQAIHLGESFPLLTALSELSLLDGGLNCNANMTAFISLCNVELTSG
ncbi:interleukin-10 receptor subunit alpha [Osmerus mordax]|uniref:interleukin-10 receptor subunit alpha n=1 Tax=Osmerus mordax TaxID=8014 RepID=UPI00350F0524